MSKPIPSNESNPWKRKTSRVVYENPWLRVSEDTVINPAGKDSLYGVVHFKNTALGILPVDEEGFTYLVGQWRYTLERYSWEIPEGGGPMGTDPLEQAKRELKEETGLVAETWEKLFEFDLSNSVTDEGGVVFLARGLKAGQARPEETEVLKVRRVSLEDAYRMVESGDIRDAISIMTLFKAKLLQSEGRLPRANPSR